MLSPTYISVKNDMLSIIPAPDKLPEIKIYFEDEEAKWFFEGIINNEHINLEESYRSKLILVAAKLGCDNIMNIPYPILRTKTTAS